jgi:hypothetical protein
MSEWARSQNPKLELVWDDVLAEYSWALMKDYVYTSDSFRALTKPRTFAQGDRDWAERIAKHYAIEMPLPDGEKPNGN